MENFNINISGNNISKESEFLAIKGDVSKIKYYYFVTFRIQEELYFKQPNGFIVEKIIPSELRTIPIGLENPVEYYSDILNMQKDLVDYFNSTGKTKVESIDILGYKQLRGLTRPQLTEREKGKTWL